MIKEPGKWRATGECKEGRGGKRDKWKRKKAKRKSEEGKWNTMRKEYVSL